MSHVLTGAVQQNGYVVSDLDAALEGWSAIGVGPWLTLREHPLEDFHYRGAKSEPVISLALSNSGPLQIEVIYQHNDAPSAYKEFLDAGREGFHHLAWWPEDYDDAVKRAVRAGWTILQAGGRGSRYTYFDAGGVSSTAIELSEPNDQTRAFNKMIFESSASWDGVSDPIRSIVL